MPTRAITPLSRPPDATVRVPGSKSVTNRALVAAALATGTSRLRGVLAADDTSAMIAGLGALGVTLESSADGTRVRVVGTGGRPPATSPSVDVRLSGTTARFLAPVLALVAGTARLDGGEPFRRRPMAPAIDALRQLGAEVVEVGEPGHLPITVTAPAAPADRVRVAGDASSQFLSGLLLVAPVLPDGLTVEVDTALVSRPYVALTERVLGWFGAEVAHPDPHTFVVAGSGYTGADIDIEPDASAASYLLAAAAITGGRVRVAGLTRHSSQGDAGFAHVLARMGAEVIVDDEGTEVRGTGRLQGIEVDLGAMSDTAQTLAAAAVFADSPTRITGIGFIRAKETDRIAAVVTELRRLGIDAREEPDGLVIHPGRPTPGAVSTYNDHRMAMSFALLGLVVPGIEIADPECVDKTFPRYFEVLDELRA
ncbi:MAG: 3-phosphoshikimate 1-carboxyvinyltransferase [Nitriliruptoraceae bacterium]